MKKYNNYIIDDVICDKPIIRIGDYVSMNHKILFRCKTCNHEWMKTPNHIIYRNQMCPVCNTGASSPMDIRKVDEILEKNNIERIGEYKGNNELMLVKCKIDGYIWESRLGNLTKSSKTGCPRCSKKENYSNERVDEIIKDTNIFRIGNYKNSKTKILFGCKACKNEWLASPSRIINKDRGCPLCYKKEERKLGRIISENGIKFLTQYPIKIENRNFLVDFYITDKLLIERNGEQHYKPVRFGGISIQKSKENYEKQVKRDEMLKKYCSNNDIKLVIIPYWLSESQVKDIIGEIHAS